MNDQDTIEWAARRTLQAHEAMIKLLASEPVGAVADAVIAGRMSLTITSRGLDFDGEITDQHRDEADALTVCATASERLYTGTALGFERLRTAHHLREAWDAGLLKITLRGMEVEIDSSGTAPETVPPEWTD